MKTLSYGTMHFIVAFTVSYSLTGSLAIAGSIAMVEPLIQTFAYNIHEKIWDKIKMKDKNSQNFDCIIEESIIIPKNKTNIQPIV